VTDPHTTASKPGSDGLGRWLLGGLAAGAVVLGLLIAAYAVGYHRGEHSTRASTASAPISSVPATTPSPTPAPGPVTVTPALVARGKSLYASDGCAACHSLTGNAGVGPSLDGSAGRTVMLGDGRRVTADDTYLERSITDPDSQVVKGYGAGVMSAATASRNLSARPDDVRALVAFIKSQH
jgi:mono/diheme cytochrome c family protein